MNQAINSNPEEVSLKDVRVGDTIRVILISYFGGETKLNITKTGKDSFSIQREHIINIK